MRRVRVNLRVMASIGGFHTPKTPEELSALRKLADSLQQRHLTPLKRVVLAMNGDPGSGKTLLLITGPI